MNFSGKIKSYYYLTKPGIVKGNLITALAGYLFGAAGNISVTVLAATLAGVITVVASGCVFNNVLDRNRDNLMARTKDRALPRKDISVRNALIYGSVLSITGFSFLYAFTNSLTVWVGIVGIFSYVVIYGYAKRKSLLSTEVGTISGSTPVLAGYTAATGTIDWAGGLLFFIMTVWQMPHFYAIAIFRMKEYKRAGLPIVSVVKGTDYAKKIIIIYIAAYAVISILPAIFGYSSISYGVIMLGASIYWLYRSLTMSSKLDNESWARKSFGTSLIVLLIFSATLSIDTFLP